MRVLWLCNVMLPRVSALLGKQPIPYGGWLTGALDGLRSINDNIQLGICCPFENSSETAKFDADNVTYYTFPCDSRRITDFVWYLPWLRSIINDFKPDILHIFGTEYAHSLAAARAFEAPERTLVSIQGLCYEYAKYYFADLPPFVSRGFNMRDVLRGETLSSQKKLFALRGENETLLLKSASHICGRTDWDKACTARINPKLNYHFCNETLRESFYKDRWDLQNCEKYSIFASSCSYPIKGFHQLLNAMPEILRRFPDAKLNVAGNSPFDIPAYKLPAYPKYIRRLIDKNGLRENVEFCGTLDEREMKERYLKSNVFVLPSAIENSPNSLGEAMLLGMPCVAADVGGVSNLMIHGREGFIYQQNSVTMLAHYVCEIFENEELAKAFSENAREHAIRTHNSETNAKRLAEIYETVFNACRS